MHLVAHAVEVRPHRRVPAAGVVAEMDAGFEQLAQGEFGHRHEGGSFRVVRLCLRGGCVAAPDPPRDTLAGKGAPRVNYRLGRRAGYGGKRTKDKASGSRPSVITSSHQSSGRPALNETAHCPFDATRGLWPGRATACGRLHRGAQPRGDCLPHLVDSISMPSRASCNTATPGGPSHHADTLGQLPPRNDRMSSVLA